MPQRYYGLLPRRQSTTKKALFPINCERCHMCPALQKCILRIRHFLKFYRARIKLSDYVFFLTLTASHILELPAKKAFSLFFTDLRSKD